MRISDWSSDVCSSDLEAREDVEGDDANACVPNVLKLTVEGCCCGFRDVGDDEHQQQREQGQHQEIQDATEPREEVASGGIEEERPDEDRTNHRQTGEREQRIEHDHKANREREQRGYSG